MCAWVQDTLLGKTRLGAREHGSEIGNQLCVNADSAFPPVSPVTGFAALLLQHCSTILGGTGEHSWYHSQSSSGWKGQGVLPALPITIIKECRPNAAAAAKFPLTFVLHAGSGCCFRPRSLARRPLA